ncbi:MAG: ribosome-associated translation inhibitor RaiA [Clostridiales bacterium]|nr:ribosome-associated translation inhibitor RaiA [Eubacteriales bacterium]MCI7095308.1 ribosome-associated translation inhibitor RaiA [Clostridiales bacterium]MDD6054620.1 ribosome-associated translation inhibitor RaiA [Clostridiales bacterium]MDD7506225.1 ribosome-associated translation inhibitor RaiA [Clostridiales bacterium]MDY5677826.1 ribosome-associated translation inhibitor RaiA [Eubacteriales bacterium]
MKLDIVAKNYTIRGNLEAIIDKKLQKLDKYFPEEPTAKVVLSGDGKRCRLELSINYNHQQFRAEVEGDTMYYNIDAALPKLERQIIKHKEKLADKSGKQPVVQDNDYVYVTGVEEDVTPEIAKVKKFAIESVDVKEAIAQLELLDHDFYIFVNSATNNVEVVYRRHDGKIGLLQPYMYRD